MYSELKLSEKLSNELTAIKLVVKLLKEELEDAKYEKEESVEELEQLRNTMEQKEKEV